MYERRGGSVFGAFLLGGLIGAVLALLFAPRSGQETREILSEKANDYWGGAGEMYASGKEKVASAVDTGRQTATEKSEQLRSKIDEARGRLQDQVAKSAEVARDKIADTTPAVKGAVDKAAEGTKGGVDAAASKAHETLDFVAKKAARDDSGSAFGDTGGAVPGAPDAMGGNPLPES
jgi:gas vesicle protein